MSALLHQVALVSETKRVSLGTLAKVATALQKQASRDLEPIWDITATVGAVEKLEDVPPGYWPIVVQDEIEEPDALGVHEDVNGQPIAFVRADDHLDRLSLTISHETLEMLVDPFGNRLMAGDSPKKNQGRVQFLVEVCDPSEDAKFAYTVNGILVSDFYTPEFFEPMKVAGVRYSFTGAIDAPRTVLTGGYLSWLVGETGHWWQEQWFNSPTPQFVDLGVLSGAKASLRSQIDRLTTKQTATVIAHGRNAAKVAGLSARRVEESTSALASAWRRQISALAAGPPNQGGGDGDEGGRRNPPSF